MRSLRIRFDHHHRVFVLLQGASLKYQKYGHMEQQDVHAGDRWIVDVA